MHSQYWVLINYAVGHGQPRPYDLLNISIFTPSASGAMHRPQTTCLHPAVLCAAVSIFLQLYLKTAVPISFSWSLFQVFFGDRGTAMFTVVLSSYQCVSPSQFDFLLHSWVSMSSRSVCPQNSSLAVLSGQCMSTILRKHLLINCTDVNQSSASHYRLPLLLLSYARSHMLSASWRPPRLLHVELGQWTRVDNMWHCLGFTTVI